MSEQSSRSTIANLGASSSVERLKDEFWGLMEEQADAFEDAAYIGMSSDLAQQCEKRRAKIANICQQITDLRRQ